MGQSKPSLKSDDQRALSVTRPIRSKASVPRLVLTLENASIRADVNAKAAQRLSIFIKKEANSSVLAFAQAASRLTGAARST